MQALQKNPTNSAGIISMQNEYCQFVMDSLSNFGSVSVRKMFGGYGVYFQGLMFGLIANEHLYFKVDDSNRADFEKAHSHAFTYQAKNKTMSLAYWLVPAEVLEEPEQLYFWAKKAHHVAFTAAAAKKEKQQTPDPNRPLDKCKNLGKKAAIWLKEIGILTEGDLRRVGAVEAFLRVKQAHGRRVTMTLLWTLHAVVSGEKWQKLDTKVKEALIQQLKV